MLNQLSTQYVITAEMQAGKVKEEIEGIASALNKVATALEKIKIRSSIQIDPNIKIDQKVIDEIISEAVKAVEKEAEGKGKKGRKKKVKVKPPVEVQVELSPQEVSKFQQQAKEKIQAIFGDATLQELQRAYKTWQTQYRNLMLKINEASFVHAGQNISEQGAKLLKQLERKRISTETYLKELENYIKQKEKEVELLQKTTETEKKSAKISKTQKIESGLKTVADVINNITVSPQERDNLRKEIAESISFLQGNLNLKQLESEYKKWSNTYNKIVSKLNEYKDVGDYTTVTENKISKLKNLYLRKTQAELYVEELKRIVDLKRKEIEALKEVSQQEDKISQIVKKQKSNTVGLTEEVQKRLENVKNLFQTAQKDFSTNILSSSNNLISQANKLTKLENILKQAEIQIKAAETTGKTSYLTSAEKLINRYYSVAEQKNQIDFIKEKLISLGLTEEEAMMKIMEEQRKALLAAITEQAKRVPIRRAIGTAIEAHSIIYRDLGAGFDFNNWNTYYTLTSQLERIKAQLTETIMRQRIFGISSYSVIPLFDEMGNKVGQFAVLVDRSGKTLINFERGLKELFSTMFYRMGVWAVATAGVYMFINGIRNAINYVIEISRQLALLKLAAEGLDFVKLYSEFGRTIAEYGGDLKEVVNITYEFTKVLRDEEAAIRATKLALMAYNISGLEYKEAATLLIGVMQQYGLNIKQLERLIDAWALASRRGTVDFKEMAQAFNQTAASAKALGISFEELTALIELSGTATGETGSVIGTFAKFILEHARDIDVLRALQEELGIAVFNTEGNFRSTAEVIRDLGERWNELTDAQKNYISNTWAGVRQGSRFKALMDLIAQGKYDQMLKEIGSAQGEAAYQNAIVMNTLEGQWRKLVSSYTVFVTNFSDTGPALALKELLNILNLFINSLQKLNILGLRFSDIFLGAIGAIGLKFYMLGRQGRSAIELMVKDITNGLRSMKDNIAMLVEGMGMKARVEPKDLTRRYIETVFGRYVSDKEIEVIQKDLNAFVAKQIGITKQSQNTTFIEKVKQAYEANMAKSMNTRFISGTFSVFTYITDSFKALGNSIASVSKYYVGLARATLTWGNISKTVINTVKGAWIGLISTIKDALKWFLLVEVAIKTIEFAVKTIDNVRENRWKMQRATDVLPYMSMQDLINMWNEWQDIENVKSLNEYERQRYVELQMKQMEGNILSDLEESEFKEYKRRELASKRKEEIKPYIDIISKAIAATTVQGVDIYGLANYDIYTNDLANNLQAQKILAETYKVGSKYQDKTRTTGKFLPLVDLAQVKKHEQELNRLLDINNREINKRVEAIKDLKDSYLDLGHSSKYYGNVMQQLFSSYGFIMDKYQDLSSQFQYIQQNYLKAKQQFEELKGAYISRGILGEVEKAYYGKGTLEKASTTELELYSNALEAYERYYSMYTKVEDALKDIENKILDIQKQMLENILTTEKYYGIWDSIKQRIELVKKAIAETRYLPYQLKVISSMTTIGTKLFGEGWNWVEYALNAYEQQLNNIFEQISQLEFAKLTGSSDLSALKQAIEEMKPIDEKIRSKAVEPLIIASNNLRNTINQQIQAIEKNTETLNELVSGTKYGFADFKMMAEGSSDSGKVSISYKSSPPADIKEKAAYMANLVGIDPRLLYATIDIETGWRNVAGDSGTSIGYGQFNLGNFRDKKSNWWKHLEEAVAMFYVPSVADFVKAEYGDDIFEKIRQRSLNNEELKQLLFNPDINLYLSALHLKQDIESAGGDIIKARKFYKGDLADVDKWRATLENYGIKNIFSDIVSEVENSIENTEDAIRKRIQDANMVLQEEVSKLNILPEFIDKQISMIERFGNIVDLFDISKVEYVNNGIKRIVESVLKFPVIFEQVADTLEKLSNKLITIVKQEITNKLDKELQFNTIFSNIVPSIAHKTSNVIQNSIQEVLQIASKLPLQKAIEFIPFIQELQDKYIKNVVDEIILDSIKQLSVISTLKNNISGFEFDINNFVGQIYDKLLNVAIENPSYVNILLPYINAFNKLKQEALYNAGYQYSDLLQVINELNSGRLGSINFYQALNKVNDILNKIYSLPRIIEQLTVVFEQLPTEVTDAYKKLSEVKILQAKRDITVLYEQLRQVYDVFNSLTPLSVDYYTVLNDLVNLHEKERQLLEQRIENTRKLFELTGKGLSEFIQAWAIYDKYNEGLLQNLRAQVFNRLVKGNYNNINEYYVLLSEIVGLEKQWHDILKQRADNLNEAFKVGAISLAEYIEKMRETVDEVYEIRSSILELYTGSFEGIKSSFNKTLTSIFTGKSENPYADFVSSIKETMAGLVSQSFTNVLFNTTGIRTLIESSVAGIVNAIFTGQRNIDTDSLKNNLNKIVGELSKYFPVFEKALGGIFETLRDNIYNAPSGFKIEPYVYEYMKGRTLEEIGIHVPTEDEVNNDNVVLPLFPNTDKLTAREEAPIPPNPLQEALNQANVSLSDIINKIGETSSKADVVTDLLKQILEVLKGISDKIVVAKIGEQFYTLKDNRTYIWSRLLGAILGQDVAWDEGNKQVIIGGQAFKPAWINEEGQSYVSIREVAETLGYLVDWDEKNNQVIISIKDVTQLINRQASNTVEQLRNVNLTGSQQVSFLGGIKVATENTNTLLQKYLSSNTKTNQQTTIPTQTIIYVPGTSSSGGTSSNTGGTTSNSGSSTTDILSQFNISNLSARIQNALATNEHAQYIEKTFPGGLVAYVNDLLRRAMEGKEPDIVNRVYNELKRIGVAHRGALVSNEQLAILRRDEMVLPPELTSRFIDFLSNSEVLLNNASGYYSSVNNNFDINITVNGNADSITVDMIRQAAKESVLEALKEQERQIRLARLRTTGVSYAR